MREIRGVGGVRRVTIGGSPNPVVGGVSSGISMGGVSSAGVGGVGSVGIGCVNRVGGVRRYGVSGGYRGYRRFSSWGRYGIPRA